MAHLYANAKARHQDANAHGQAGDSDKEPEADRLAHKEPNRFTHKVANRDAHTGANGDAVRPPHGRRPRRQLVVVVVEPSRRPRPAHNLYANA
jgi:hypothetical protein